ncbi:DUF2306 domain-containing protein [Sinomicrobium sp. M5D2P9]
MKKAVWIILGILSVLIGLYPALYFMNDNHFGLLGSKAEELLSSGLYNLGFYGHIAFGGLALLVGWLQFGAKWRQRNIGLHRKIGKVYVLSVLISGLCGFFIGFYATGGIIPASGFISLSVVWLTTTVLGFDAARKRQIDRHGKFMIYSYACCFAAVTLRVWLPLLEILLGNFVDAYRIVAWLAWVPNLIVAYFMVKSKSTVKNDLRWKER